MIMTKKRFLMLLELAFTMVSIAATYLAIESNTELWTMIWGTIAILGWSICISAASIWAIMVGIAYYEKLPNTGNP